MEWTYLVYNTVNSCISWGLVFIIGVIVFVTFYTSTRGKQFISDHIIGTDEEKVANEAPSTNNTTCHQCQCTKDPTKTISCCLCTLATLVLGITAVLIFHACFLSIRRVHPNDSCPEYPMDCFIFNNSKVQPITNKMNFHCDPLNKTEFPLNMTDAIAWCYGWVYPFQTVEGVLDQLGVCTGLIGLFTILLALIVYLSNGGRIILSLIMIISCLGLFGTLPALKWSFAPLTFAVLGLGISLGIFGFILCCHLPKKDQTVSPS